MLDQFLITAFSQNKAEREKRAFIDNLKKLPRAELLKLATGEIKVADLCPTKDATAPQSWLEQFKGTPLFQQALQLEQQELQVEADRIRKQMSDPQPWVQQDQIRLQKRLLELQLVGSNEVGAPPAPEAGMQGAGGLGPEALGVTDGGLQDRPDQTNVKTSSLADARRKLASVKMKKLAAELAQGDAQKLAAEKASMDAGLLSKLEGAADATKKTVMRYRKNALPTAMGLNAQAKSIASGMSAVKDPFPKVAFSLPPGLTGQLGGAASRVMSKLGPQGTKALIGAGVGAVGGGLLGAHEGGARGAIGGALGGAALGGAAGHVGGNVAASMAKGVPLGRALQVGAARSGGQLLGAGRQAVSEGKQLLGGLRGAAPTSIGAQMPGPVSKGPSSLGEFLPGPKAPVA